MTSDSRVTWGFIDRPQLLAIFGVFNISKNILITLFFYPCYDKISLSEI